MKDIRNKELQVGDKVILLEYRGLPNIVNKNSYSYGKVVGHTKCTVRVETFHTKQNLEYWNNHPEKRYPSSRPCGWVNKCPHALVKL